MKRYGILLAVFMAFVLAFTLTSGCSTPKKATKEDVTKSGTKPGLSDEELAKQRAEQEARERALREQAIRDQEARDGRSGGGSRGGEPQGPLADLFRFRPRGAQQRSPGDPGQGGRSAQGKPEEDPHDRRQLRRPRHQRVQPRPRPATGPTAAARYLQNLGIDRKRIKTISYGEERPVCSEATEACWHKNRNATFVYSERK